HRFLRASASASTGKPRDTVIEVAPFQRRLMRIATWLTIALVLSACPLHAQPAPGAARPQYRCEVPYFTGATSPQGASVKMTVVSDGLACVIPNWGVPD